MIDPNCPKCGGPMERGIVLDRGCGTLAQPDWREGSPERSIWTGLKTKGKHKLAVVTWRCGRCGFSRLARRANNRSVATMRQPADIAAACFP